MHTTAGDMAEKGCRTYEQRYGEVMLQLPVEVDVVAATYLGESRAHGVGIWDTGSNRTVISKALADSIGLGYVYEDGMGLTNMNNVDYVGTAMAALELDGQMRTPFIPVVVGTLIPGTHPDLLIGMDVIAFGRLTVDSRGDETVLTFEMNEP